MERVSKATNILLRIFIVVCILIKIILKEYSNIEILALTFVLSFYDAILQKILKLELSNLSKIFLTSFIFLAQCLGTVFSFYHIFGWWDIMLHLLSGFLFYLIGKEVLDFIRRHDNKVKLNKLIIVLFAFCFSLSIGVVWEIFEFSVDNLLGKNTQYTRGLVGEKAIMDTMIDLISCTIATSLIAVFDFFKKVRE